MPGLTGGFDLRAVARFAADADALGVRADDALLAVSGGGDSLALLLLARAALGDRIAVATVDHGLSPDGAVWAGRVADLCETIGVDHQTFPADVIVDGEGVQAAARRARYAVLAAEAARIGRATIVTAHQANDQAETLVMRLMRGSGLAGLAGVREARELAGGARIVRPLLGWTRAELAAVVGDAGVAAVDDPANHDPRHDRTRARAIVGDADPLPFVRAAAHLAEAEAALAWAARRFAAERIARDGGEWRLDATDLPAEIIRRLLVGLFVEAGATAPDGPSVDRLAERLAGGQTSTLAGLRFAAGPVWRVTRAPAHRAAPIPSLGSVQVR